MKRLYIEDMYEIVSLMYEKVFNGCTEATFIGLYEDAAEVLRLLSQLDESTFYQVSIEPVDWDGYDKEFLVTLDDEYNIWCEKAYRCESKAYIRGLVDCVIIADDCNRGAICEPDTDDIYVASFADVNENEEDEKCLSDSNSEYTYLSRTKDGKITGFTKSWSNTDANGIHYYSSYSHYGDNEDAVKRLAKEFGINI